MGPSWLQDYGGDQPTTTSAPGWLGDYSSDSFFGGLSTPPDQNHSSFFGGLAHDVGNVIHGAETVGKGVGSFFGGMVKGIASDAVQAAKTVKNIGQASYEAVVEPHQQNAVQATLKQAQDDYNAGKITLEQMNQKYHEFQTKSAQLTSHITGEGILKDKTSPITQGAASANTFLNLATLGVGSGVKALAEGGARDVAAEVANNGLRAGAKKTAQILASNDESSAARKELAAEVAQGGAPAARAALGHVGSEVGTNALVGGAQGALGTYTDPNDHNGNTWHNALIGALTAGGVGAGGSLLDRDVRTGLRAVPGQVSDAAARTQDALMSNTSLGETGGIKNPFFTSPDGSTRPGNAVPSTNSGNPNVQSPQLSRDLTPAEHSQMQIAQDVASQYHTPEQYVKDAVDQAYSYDKSQTGGNLQKNGDEYYRTSTHSKFYSDYYAANGHAPSKAAFTEQVQKALETGTDGGGIVDPSESDIYKLIQDRVEGNNQMINSPEGNYEAARLAHMDALSGNNTSPVTTTTPGRIPSGLPARPATGQLDINGEPFTTPTPGSSQLPAGLPKGPLRGQESLPGQSPEEQLVNNPGAAKIAANEKLAQENNFIDFINPANRADLEKPSPEQIAMNTEDANPYVGQQPDLSRLAIGPGKTEDLTPAEAKARFEQTGTVPSVKNELPAGQTAIPLHATSDETNNATAIRETPGGKVLPLSNNNAPITKDVVTAIRHIAEDDTGSRFTATRTHELNLEEATAPRGGTKSAEFRSLDKLPQSIRQHTGEYTEYVDKQKEFANKFVKEFDWSPKKDLAARQYIEAKTPKDRETVAVEFKKQFGSKSAAALEPLRQKWITDKEALRSSANAEIEKYAGKDRMIGDLGENYLTRVYKQGGVKGFRNTVMDLAHSGLDKIGGKGKGALFNLENPDGYLSKESDTAGGVLRPSEGIPLNSEFAKPNTMFLSAAKARTAKNPQGELEGALSSMMHYYQAVARAKYFTKDIATGRTTQKAIEMVNGETGNLRQMYQSYDDMINSVAGKTSRFDRAITDSKTGNMVVNAATKIQRNVAKSTILGSANSALAQTAQLPLVAAEAGPANLTKGMRDMFHYLGSKNDSVDPINQSALMKARYPSDENPFKIGAGARAANKATDVIAKPFRLIEKASTDLAWRSSYNKALQDGFSGPSAVAEADRITAKIVGERSPGARAALYESKALGPVTSYTLEVNQMYQVAKQYFKRDPKKAAMLVGAIWLYNQGYQAMTGNKMNADPLAAGLGAAKILTTGTDAKGNHISPGERVLRAGGRLAGEAVDAMPLGDTVAAQLYPEKGFHVPFAGGAKMLTRADVFGNTNLGRYGGGTPLASGISNPLLTLGIPGMGQVQRSIEGANAYNAGASVSPAGTTRFTITPGTENYLRALLWGQYGTQQGQQYLSSKNANLAGS